MNFLILLYRIYFIKWHGFKTIPKIMSYMCIYSYWNLLDHVSTTYLSKTPSPKIPKLVLVFAQIEYKLLENVLLFIH